MEPKYGQEVKSLVEDIRDLLDDASRTMTHAEAIVFMSPLGTGEEHAQDVLQEVCIEVKETVVQVLTKLHTLQGRYSSHDQ